MGLHTDNFGNMNIGNFERLKQLYISGNIHYKKIDFKSISNLEILSLQGNNITEIPIEILSLIKLSSLNLSNNHLIRLPEYIIELPYLEEFIIRRNNFENLRGNIIRINWLLSKTNRFIKIHISELIFENFTNLDVWK